MKKSSRVTSPYIQEYNEQPQQPSRYLARSFESTKILSTSSSEQWFPFRYYKNQNQSLNPLRTEPKVNPFFEMVQQRLITKVSQIVLREFKPIAPMCTPTVIRIPELPQRARRLTLHFRMLTSLQCLWRHQQQIKRPQQQKFEVSIVRSALHWVENSVWVDEKRDVKIAKVLKFVDWKVANWCLDFRMTAASFGQKNSVHQWRRTESSSQLFTWAPQGKHGKKSRPRNLRPGKHATKLSLPQHTRLAWGVVNLKLWTNGDHSRWETKYTQTSFVSYSGPMNGEYRHLVTT